MSLPQTTAGYALDPDEGEALWFGGALIVVKATGAQTQGRLTAAEMVAPKGAALPLHVHRGEDELFVVLAGEIRFQLGEAVIEGVPGSLVYGARAVPHSLRIESPEARMLLLVGPAGIEEYLREGGKPARFLGLPPADEQFPDPEAIMKIAARYGQDIIGPPVPPRG
jgi:quercetin dioxygenase-like cupin family protein